MEFKKLRTSFTILFGVIAAVTAGKYIITGIPIDETSGNFIIWCFGVTFGVTGGTKMLEKESWNRNVLKPQAEAGTYKQEKPPEKTPEEAEI